MTSDEDDTVRGPKQQPVQNVTRPEGQGSAETNGYWLHDESGPKDYVAAVTEGAPETDSVSERFAEGLYDLPGLNGADVRLRPVEGGYRLEGQVDREADHLAVCRLAEKVARGQPVVTDVRILER